jgi:LysM repeat protein
MVGDGGVRESFAKRRDAVVNREQKIALIIGFAVVLVVGVLVSDHLSGAQRLQLADATEGDSGRIEAAPVAYLPDFEGTTPPITTTEREADRNAAVEPMRGMRTPDPEPFEFAQGGLGDVSPIGDVLNAANDTEQASGEGASNWTDSVTEFAQRVAEGLNNGVREAAVVDRGGNTSPVLNQPKAQHEPARPVEVKPQAAPVRHIVQQNESLYKIAKRYLGDGSRWREIAKANTGKVGQDGSVRTGVSLVIPGTTADTPAPIQPKSAPAKTGPIRYTVKKNDSLSEISQKYLGTTKRMKEIIAANRGKIDDPDDIRVGMVLNIPAKS